MLLKKGFLIILFAFLLPVHAEQKDKPPIDPYESVNRAFYKFNTAVDATVFRPPAKLYKKMVPNFVKKGIDNFFHNVRMLPTIANDLLQKQWKQAIKDGGRFTLNSTLGAAGFMDIASKVGYPEHVNDLGITFAKWGNEQSSYLVLPLLGPSTIRDSMASLFDYAIFTPYPYLNDNALIYGLLGIQYLDLRAQLLDLETITEQAIDPYIFYRDAYLQNRNYLINGQDQNVSEQNIPGDEASSLGSLYVDEEEIIDDIDDNAPKKVKQNATHSSISTRNPA